MRKSVKTHTIDVVFVLAIACAFAASILMVLMMGVNIYSGIQQTSTEDFHKRVALSYIAAKVHAHDNTDTVTVGTFADSSALFLEEDFYGVPYKTVIYTYNGWIRELFSEKYLDLPAISGTPLLEVESLTFELVQPNLLYIEYLDTHGNVGNIFVNIRSEGGEAI